MIILELVRVIVIWVVGTWVLSYLEISLYGSLGIALIPYFTGWILFLANFLIVFVLYRNLLQFRGWFKSSKNTKLNRQLSVVLLGVSAILLILPLLIK